MLFRVTVSNIIDKVFPRHPYRTRATTRAMDQMEKKNEEMRIDIDSLKSQIAQILEKLSELAQK